MSRLSNLLRQVESLNAQLGADLKQEVEQVLRKLRETISEAIEWSVRIHRSEQLVSLTNTGKSVEGPGFVQASFTLNRYSRLAQERVA